MNLAMYLVGAVGLILLVDELRQPLEENPNRLDRWTGPCTGNNHTPTATENKEDSK